MKTIWKYELETTDKQTVKMPYGAKILTVQIQNETPCLWCLVVPNYILEEREIQIIGTGHDINDLGGEYIGTYQLREGNLVFHVYG